MKTLSLLFWIIVSILYAVVILPLTALIIWPGWLIFEVLFRLSNRLIIFMANKTDPRKWMEKP